MLRVQRDVPWLIAMVVVAALGMQWARMRPKAEATVPVTTLPARRIDVSHQGEVLHSFSVRGVRFDVLQIVHDGDGVRVEVRAHNIANSPVEFFWKDYFHVVGMEGRVYPVTSLERPLITSRSPALPTRLDAKEAVDDMLRFAIFPSCNRHLALHFADGTSLPCDTVLHPY